MQNGNLIKNYKIIEILGEGKTSKTFLVEDINKTSNSNHFILKQYYPLEFTQENYQVIREKFNQEFSVLSYLGDNTVQIPNFYETFEIDQTFCVIQEWIEGDSLSSLIKNQGVMTQVRVKEILLMILPLLNYIHNQGVIHGNLRPDNIIFEESTGLPVLIDFGSLKSTMGITKNPQGQIINTLRISSNGYTPNEQIVGNPVYSSDIYSLSLTAIYLLTQKEPNNLSINKLTGEILWRDYEVNISSNFADILDKGIKTDLSDRYLSAKDILHDLKAKTSKNQTLNHSPYNQLFESNMNNKSPLPFSGAAIITTIIALLTVGGIFYNYRVSVNNQKLLEEKQEEISQVENSTQESPVEDNIQNIDTQTNINENIDTKTAINEESQPLSSNNEISTNIENPPQTSQTPSKPLVTENSAQETNSTTETNTTEVESSPKEYIDIVYSNAQNFASKMPDNSIALTFDDGPHPEYTPQVLDILAKHNVKATFFLVGKRVEARCDIVKRIINEGHEIANHTYTHPFLTQNSPTIQAEELENAQQAIENCVGYRPHWFRAPYGDQSQTTLQIAHNLGLNTALWTIDTEDWSAENTTEIILNAGLKSDGQDIILMHDSPEFSEDFAHKFQHPKAAKTREATINAIEPMIEEFKNQDVIFVTMSQAFPDAK